MTDSTMKQYWDYLEVQRDLLLRSKAQKGQKPPYSMRPSRAKLDYEFTQMARQLAGQGYATTVRSTFIGEAYPPCTIPLSRLVPIHLRDLTLETQHRGRLLVVRAFSVPNRMVSVQNAVEDEFGDVERLAIYNLLSIVEAEDVLPRGAVVAVKEPYYKRTSDGGVFVRADHPSDVILLKPGNPLIPRALTTSEDQTVGLPAFKLKERGNAAFKKGNWQKAEDAYSSALETARTTTAEDDLKQVLQRNRAMARLRLGRYELARADALASMEDMAIPPGSPKMVNAKALYLAGRASYEMGEFGRAREYLEAVLALDARQKEAVAELARAKKRLAEQEDGAYDFEAMAKSATKSRACLDHASFLKNTHVAPAGDRGRGLFASKALEPGEVVFVEKAFQVAHSEKDTDMSVLLNINTNRVAMGPHSLLLQGLVDKMRWNPTLASQYLDLYDGGTFGESKEAIVVDGQVAVDTFRVQIISEYNGFGCPRVRSGEGKDDNAEDGTHSNSTGIWLRAACANHACLPNATRAFIGDMMIVRAVRPIRAGEEIFAGYDSSRKPFGERQEKLRKGYGFDCNCVLCAAEAQVSQVLVDKRSRLAKRVEKFLAAHPLTPQNFRTVPSAARTEAKNILADTRATYPQALFGQLPRMACIEIGIWEAQVGPAQAGDDLQKMLLVLRDSGYMVAVKNGHARVDRTAAVATEAAVHAAVHASRILASENKLGAASTLLELGLEVYTSRFCLSHEFKDKFV